MTQPLHLLLSAEARVLLLAIGGRGADGAMAAAVQNPALDWSRLIWLAEREKATIAVRDALRGLDDGVVPNTALLQVERLARVTEFRMLRLEQLLAGALDTLSREKLEVVLLKGAGLATTVYGAFTARPMYDVDMLVEPVSAHLAWNALRKAGWTHDAEECPPDFYRTHYHLPPLDDALGTGLSLELHTAPTDGAVSLSAEAMWKNARPVGVLGRRALVPSTTHQILHLAAHFAWTHGIASAAWRTFHDLERIVASDSVDWDAVLAEAGIARAGTACYWTFQLARTLAGASIPDDVLERLKPPRPEWLLRVLERHYAAGLFLVSTAPCPSVRMTQVLWSAGMAPRWSGHGSVRPWHRGEMWALASGGQIPLSVSSRLRGHMLRGAQWRRYAAALLGKRSDRGPSAP